MFWLQYAAPQRLYALAGRIYPLAFALAAVLTVIGLYLGFWVAPADFQQGQAYRIIFVHVPASWMSMLIYVAMAFWAWLGLSFKTRVSGMMTQALAPTGALCCFLSLWTGALWGKPMWGAWWVWDARLTSELILLFLYLGYIALTRAAPTAPGPWWHWWVWSTSQSFISRSNGGIPCTRARRYR